MKSKNELNDASRETKANPHAWFEHGNMLLQSSIFSIKTPLAQFMHEDLPKDIVSAKIQRRFSQTYIYRLLLGSSLECFLKAHPNNSDSLTHNCVELAEKIGIPITEHQKTLMHELSLFTVIGRYPFVSDREFRKLNSGKKTFLDVWEKINNEASKQSDHFVTDHKIHFGFIDMKDAEIEIEFVRKIREQVKSSMNYGKN